MFVLDIYRFKEFPDNGDGNGSTLSRGELRDGGTVVWKGFFVEPAGPDTTERNKDRRIPQGCYEVLWKSSSKTGANIKGRLPLLFNSQVPEDRMIRIHVGNFGKDTEGCLCPGLTANPHTGAVNSSKAALTQLLDIIFDQQLAVVIHNEETLWH